MTTQYPDQVDTTSELPNLSSEILDVVNGQRDAILAIETELGVNPSGSASTVRDRLDDVSTAVIGLVATCVPATSSTFGFVKLSGSLSGDADAPEVILDGDCTGPSDANTVEKIQNIAVLAGTPVDGYVLTYVDGYSRWEPKILPIANLVARADNDPAHITSGYAPLGFVRTGTKWIDPRSSTPAADLSAAHAAGYHAQLNGDATYTWETTATTKSGKAIICKDGLARIVPASGWTHSGADNETDPVILVASTVSGTASGTTQRNAYRRTRNVRINFNPSVGSWLLIKSTSSGTLNYTYGSSVVGYELVQVKSVGSDQGSGVRDVTLTKDLQQCHASGSNVYAVTTVMQDVEISNLFLDFAGSSHSVGIVATSTDRLVIDNCHFSGFSRAQMVTKDGCTGSFVDMTTHLGTNCGLRMQSSSGRVNFNTIPGGDRKHSSGIPRGLITLRHNCSDVHIDGTLIGATTGISCWGGTGVRLGQVTIRDMDPIVRAALDTECVPLASTIICAGALDMGNFASPSNWGEFQFGVTIDNLRIEDCGSVDGGGNGLYPSVYLCDINGIDINNISIVNMGASGQLQSGSPESASFLEGIVCYDIFQGRIHNCFAQGINAPVWFDGNGNSIRIDELEIRPQDAFSNNAWTVMRLGNAGATNVSIGVLKVGSPEGYFSGAGFTTPTTETMHRITIDTLIYENIQQRWDNCFFAYQTDATSVARGERMELFATTVSSVAARGLRNPSTTLTGDKVIAICGHAQAMVGGASQNTWCLVSKGPYQSIKTSSTPAYCDPMKAGTGRDVVVDGLGLDDSCGTVVQLKSYNLVQVFNKK